jgi:hypothetical protein
MAAQLIGRRRGAGERHDILARQMREQIAAAAADELNGTFRQESTLDNAPEDKFREIGGGCRGLDDRGHARKQRGREFLEHPPHRKVERVDVQRRAFAGHADMLPDEGSRLRQRLHFAVHVHMAVGQLTDPATRVGEQRADAAIDVDP